MFKKLTRVSVAVLAAALLVILVRVSLSGTSAAANRMPPGPVASPPEQVRLAAPGRVEGRTETIAVGAGMDGVVKSILVKEGDPVAKGQPLAEIGCEDLRSALNAATAEADASRQIRTRLLRGSREEERQAAAQQTAAARAVVDQTSAQLDRMTKLQEAAAVSRSDFEQAVRDNEVAEAAYKRALRQQELVNAPPLPEEVSRADADVRAAEDRVKQAREKLDKCVVRAPISGTILRVDLRQGESFALLAPRPLFTVADVSERRVRAEVDERDIGKVQVGQKVEVSCDAFPSRRFSGTVTRVSASMGRKTVQTGDPADKADRDVLEVVAQLSDEARALPVGLRTTVHFLN